VPNGFGEASRQIANRTLEFCELERLSRVGSRVRTVVNVLMEGSIPELDRRIEPNRFPAQGLELVPAERDSVEEERSASRRVPAEKEPEQARLACARRPDDRYVLAGADVECEIGENRTPGHLDAHTRETNRHRASLAAL